MGQTRYIPKSNANKKTNEKKTSITPVVGSIIIKVVVDISFRIINIAVPPDAVERFGQTLAHFWPFSSHNFM